MTPPSPGASDGIPEDLKPFILRLADAKNWMITLGLVVAYVVIGIVLLLFYYSIGQAITFSSGLQIFAISGEGISVAVLVISARVEHYSQKKYVSSYTEKAAKDYPKKTPEEREEMLRQYHGLLKNKASNILKYEVGFILTAISTIMGFVGSIAKG